MIKVIIADDEERMCNLIRILTNWEQLDMELQGVASNGLEALELIESGRPEILITDIRMPGLDGIELIQRAKALAPDLEIIIISGYAQFDYAQTAIKFGVGEYLLKPVNKDALNSALQRMGQRRLARIRNEAQMESLNRANLNERERLRMSLITDLLDGRLDADTASALERNYYFMSPFGAYRVFMLKFDYALAEFSAHSLELVRAKSFDIISAGLSDCVGDAVLMAVGDVLYGVVNCQEGGGNELRRALRDGLNQLVEMRSLFGNVSFSMALGTQALSPFVLPLSLGNAREMISERLIDGTGRLLEGSLQGSALREQDLLSWYTERSAHAIDVLSDSEADQAADSLYRAALDVPNAHGWEILELVTGAGRMFVSRLGMEGQEEALKQFSKQLSHCTDVQSLFECLKVLQRSRTDKRRELMRSQDAQPIRTAKQYIKKNFGKPITLEEVASASGFSENYFSTLFKKETGEGFAKYLVRVRVDAARGLLRDTRLPVAEICRQVGYGDIKHFTHTFKQLTGLNPGEYRKIYG